MTLVDVKHCSCLVGKRYCDIWVEVNEFEPNTWCGQIISSLCFDVWYLNLLSVLLQLDALRPAVNAIVKVFVETTCFADSKCNMQLFSDCADIIIKLIPFSTILSVGIKRKKLHNPRSGECGSCGTRIVFSWTFLLRASTVIIKGTVVT